MDNPLPTFPSYGKINLAKDQLAKHPNKFFETIAQLLIKANVKKFGLTRSQAYLSLSALDLLLLVLVSVISIKPAQQMISPFISSLQTINTNLNFQLTKTTPEVFSFAPGSSPRKLDKIELEGLDILSFFDVPVKADGSLDQESVGYETFYGEKAGYLFEEAQFKGTKVLLTLTQTKADYFTNFMNDTSAQQAMIDEVIAVVRERGIDGVTIDFEPRGEYNSSYRTKFSKFVANLTSQMHSQVQGSQVTVAVPSSKSQNQGIYDLAALSANSDRILVIADDFIVPEVANDKPSNPVFGFNSEQYYNDLSLKLARFQPNVSTDKLVLERAWYGNGDKYPLYIPSSKPPVEEDLEPAHVLLDSETVNRLVRGVPLKARESARKNIPLIGKALQDEGILDSNVLSYALATIEHETAGTFEPVNEYSGTFSARRLGYEGGTNYHGRGFIQLTHLRNYKKMGERIGMGDQLAQHPELASNPEVSAKILAAFFKDNNISNLASKGRFVAARTPVNPDNNGWLVAELAWKYGEYQ